jgi:hypothetical protein
MHVREVETKRTRLRKEKESEVCRPRQDHVQILDARTAIYATL